MNNLPSELIFDQIYETWPVRVNKWVFSTDCAIWYYVNPINGKCDIGSYTHHNDIQKFINEYCKDFPKLLELVDSSDPECYELAKQLTGWSDWTFPIIVGIIKELI